MSYLNQLGINNLEKVRLRNVNVKFLNLYDEYNDSNTDNALYWKNINGSKVLFFNGNQIGGGFFQLNTDTLNTTPQPYNINLQNKDLTNVGTITTNIINTDKINIVNSSSILNTDTIYKNGGFLYFNNDKIAFEDDNLFEFDNVAETRIRAKIAGSSAYPNITLKDKSLQETDKIELKNQSGTLSGVNSGYSLLYNIGPNSTYTKPYLHNENKPVSPFRYYQDPQNQADTYVNNYPINMNNNLLQNIQDFSTNNSSTNVINGVITSITSILDVSNAATFDSVLIQNQLVNNGSLNQNGALTMNNNSTFNSGFDAIFNGGVQINGGFSAGTPFNNHIDGRINNILNTTTNISNFFNSTIDSTILPYNPGTYNVIETNSRNSFEGVLKSKHVIATDDMSCDIIYASEFIKKPSSSDVFDFIGSAGSGLLSLGAKTLGAMALTAGLVFAGGAVAMGALDTGGGEESLVVFNNAGGPIYPNLSNVAQYYGIPSGGLGDYYYGIGYGSSNLFHNELEPSSKSDIQNAYSYGLSNWSNRIVINNIPVQTEYSGPTQDYSAIAYFDGDLLDPDVKTKCYPCALGYTHEYFYSVGLKNYENFQGQAQAWRGGSNHRTLQNLNGAYRLYSVNGILHFNQEPYRKYNDTSFLYGLILPPTNQSASPNDKLYQDLNNHLIWDGNRVLDSANYGSYALPLTGGTLTGNLNIENTGTNFYKSRFLTNQFGLSIQVDNQGNGVFSEKIRVLDNAINIYNALYSQYDLIFQNNDRGIYFQDGSGGTKLLKYSTLNNRLEFDGVSVASPFNQSGQQAILKNNLLSVSVQDSQYFSMQNSFGTQGQIISTSGSTNGYLLKGRANNTDAIQEDKILIDYQKIKFYEDIHNTGNIILNNNSTDGYTRSIIFDDSNTNKKLSYDNVNDRLLFDGVPIASSNDAIFNEQVSFNKGLEINDYLPSILANKLYSVSSQLYWNGALVGMSNDADKYFSLSGLNATSATGINSYDFNNANIELTRGTHNSVISVSDTGTPANDSLNIATNRDDITLNIASSYTVARFKRFTNTPTNNQMILGEDNPWNLQGAFNRLAFKTANTAFIDAVVHNTASGDSNMNIQATNGTVKLSTSFNNVANYHSGTPMECQAYTNTTNNYGDVIIKNRGANGVVPWTQQGGLRFKDEQNGSGVYCMNLTNYGTPSLNLCYDTNYNEEVSFKNRTNASQIDFNSTQAGTGNNYNLHLGTWNGNGYTEFYLYGTHNNYAIGLGGGSTARWVLSSSGWTNQSDRRVKSNIQEINDIKTLEFLEKATPKTYTLRKKFNNEIGFIADDIQELGTEFVNTSEDYIDIENISGKKEKDIIICDKPHNLKEGGNYINAVRFFCECNDNPFDFEFEIIDNYKIKLIKHLCNECKEENANINIVGQKVNDFKNVNYTSMAVMSQRCIQYLHKENKQLNEDIFELDEIIQNQQNKINDLENKLNNVLELLQKNNIN